MNEPSFSQSFDIMHKALRGEYSTDEASKLLQVPYNRLFAYQKFVKEHIRGVLEKIYTILPDLLGDTLWGNLVQRYYQSCPANNYELNTCVRDFPFFISTLDDDRDFGLTEFHAELCELEWQEFAAYADKRDIPDSAQIPKAILNPTLTVLQFTYPIADFVDAWRNHDGPQEKEIPERFPQVVFVFRHPIQLNHVFYKATDSLLFAFKFVCDAYAIEQATSVSQLSKEQVISTLEHADACGLIILPNQHRFLGKDLP